MRILGNFTTREKLKEDITNYVEKFNKNIIEKATLYINDEAVIYKKQY